MEGEEKEKKKRGKKGKKKKKKKNGDDTVERRCLSDRRYNGYF